MAEAEVVVGAESVVCESKEETPPVEETQPEATTGPEEGMPEAVAEVAVTQDPPDHKRKLEDLEPLDNDEAPSKKQQIDGSDSTSEPAPAEDEVAVASEVATQEIEGEETDGSGHPEAEKPVPVADVYASDATLVSSVVDGSVDEQQPGHVGEIDGAGLIQLKLETEPVGNGQIPSTENIQHAFVDDTQKPSPVSPHQGSLPHTEQQTSFDLSTSRKIEVPNNKVGVLIGKSGETIRYLQINSGVKIQITRDGDIDPHSSTRLVELIGTLENINKAELLIKDVIAEVHTRAIAGGSPSLVARGFSAPQSGGEQTEIQIPSQKVGMIIGKGGETIKSLQTRSGARIQLLPQHLPDGDASKERTVRITGSKKQVESARELIKDVMNQVPSRSSQLSSTYGQHAFRPPRGPAPVAQWGPRGANSTHQQRGMYPPQTTQYPQSYGGYSQQQPPPRGWEQQRAAATPLQTVSPSGGYGYYNQGGPAPNTQPSNQLPGPIPSSTPAPMNYNYSQSQAPDGYGHQAAYAQPPPAQHTYGHGYSEPKYDSQQPQHMYGQQQQMGSQPGIYGQQQAAATPYGKPAYEASPSYGPPRAPQPGDPMYQVPPASQYPSSAPMQQPYPYGSSAPTQQAATYGQAYGPADGYSQQTSAGYPQHGGQPAPGYGQVGQAAAPAYTQPVPTSGGYSQYPSSQPSYGDQTAQANVNYGYQGGVPDATGYAGNVPSSGYAAAQPVVSQPGYSQPQPNPSGYYDQSMPPQSGYGAVPTAPTGYGKSVSPQPGYGGQYDATQMYGPH